MIPNLKKIILSTGFPIRSKKKKLNDWYTVLVCVSEFAKRRSWFFRPKVHRVPVKWDKHKSNKQQQTIGYWVTWYDQIKWYDLLYTLHCYSKSWTKTSVKGDVRFIIAYPSFCWRAIFKYCYSLHNSLISNATLQKNIIEIAI